MADKQVAAEPQRAVEDVSPGVAEARPLPGAFATVIATGSVDDVARLMRGHGAQRDPIMFALQQQRGNGFAQQVIAAVTTTPTRDGDDKDDEEGGQDDLEDVWNPHALIDRFAGDAQLREVTLGHKTFSKGDRGPVIRRLQQALFDLAYEPISITGVFDDAMEARVKELQGNAKLPQTGTIDDKSFDSLQWDLHDRRMYAGDAQVMAPNLHAEPGKHWDGDAPPTALMRDVHNLGPDEKAEAEAALTGNHPPIDDFKPKLPDGTYRDKLDRSLRDIVDGLWETKGATAAKREKHTFDLDVVVDIGNLSKQTVDGVFGSYAKGRTFKANDNLDDKYKHEANKIAKMDDKEKLAKARGRLERIMTTNDTIRMLNRDHDVDVSRTEEQGIINGVLDSITKAYEPKLLELQKAWGGSTDPSDGHVHMLLFKSSDDDTNRAKMWSMYLMLIHEYIHALAHPRWNHWRETKHAQNREAGTTLREGVTELLARTVMSVIKFEDKDLKKAVEGHYYNEDAPPEIDRDSYETEEKRAELLVGAVGIDNLYAAYFLGQVDRAGT